MGRKTIFNAYALRLIICAGFLNFAYAETSPFLYWKSYVVQKGDTLDAISLRIQKQLSAKISRQDILRAILEHNPIVRNKNKIYPNQSFLVPSIYVEPESVERNVKSEPVQLARFEEHKHHTQKSIGVEPELSFSQIDSKDSDSNAEGVFNSKLNVGVDIYLEHEIDTHQKGMFIFGMDRKVFEAPDGSTLRNQQENYHHLSYRYLIQKKRLRTMIEVGLFENIVVSSLDVNAFSLDAIWQPFLRTGLAYDFLNQENISFSAFGNVSYILSGFSDRFAVDAGYELNPGLRIEKKISAKASLLGQIQYRYRYNESDISNQSIQELAGSLGYRYQF